MYYCTIQTVTVRFSKPLFVLWHFGLLGMSVVSLFYLGTNYIHKHSAVDPPLSNVGIKESHLVQYYCRVHIGTARFSKPLLLLWHFGPLDMSGNPEALQGNPVTWVSNVMGGRLYLILLGNGRLPTVHVGDPNVDFDLLQVPPFHQLNWKICKCVRINLKSPWGGGEEEWDWRARRQI